MILQSTDSLEAYIGNKYSLVIVAAKRARQLKEGHTPLSRDPSPNPLSIALREVEEEKLIALAPPVEELAPAPRDVITSLVTSADFDLDEDLDLEDTDAVDDLAALLVGADDEEEEAEATETEEDDALTPVVATASDDLTDEEEEEEESEEEDVPIDDSEDEDDA
jgi:DNA-directed RNA polymerase subunit omega